MTAAHVAIILLVNSLQIALPQPAFVEAGRAWVPARAVLEACGFTVDWDSESSTLLCARAETTLAMQPGKNEIQIGSAALAIEQAPRMEDGLLFLPSTLLQAAIGGSVAWDGPSKMLSVECRALDVVAITIEELQTNPFRYVNRMVQITGEYWGTGDWPQTGVGAAWVLRGRDETVTCRSRSGRGIAAEIPQMPYGQRINIEGMCKMHKDGSLYLDIVALENTQGPAGLTCVLETDRSDYGSDEPVLVEVMIANYTGAVVDCGVLSIQICDSRGQMVWHQDIDVPEKAPAGWTHNARFIWADDCSENGDGFYHLRLVSEGEQWAHQRRFTRHVRPWAAASGPCTNHGSTDESGQ